MKDSTPLVSIITPSYNYGKYLPEALDSLITQTYTNWECIIVNDGSTDNTEEIALKYVSNDPRFHYIHQTNKGLPGARNAALKQAKGDYIQLLDADDLLESEKLLLQVGLLESNKEVGLIYSNMLIFYDVATKKEPLPFVVVTNPSTVSGSGETIIDVLIKDVFYLPGCALFRRKVFEQVGFFNEDLYGLEDWNYWFRAALLGFEFYHDERIGTRLIVRDHEANMSKAYFKMLNARISARKDIIEISKKLKLENKITIGLPSFKKMMLKHNIYLTADSYEFDFHNRRKLSAFKNIFKHAYYVKNPFFPIVKITSSILARLKG